MSVCLADCSSVYLSVSLCISRSVKLYVCVRLSVCFIVCIQVFPSIELFSVCLYVWLDICLSVCLCVCLSVLGLISYHQWYYNFLQLISELNFNIPHAPLSLIFPLLRQWPGNKTITSIYNILTILISPVNRSTIIWDKRNVTFLTFRDISSMICSKLFIRE